ncbi:DUF2861 family protein [Vibrio gazogenes]|uniref:DUF2861 domain-containing protein n=1 Tax=Vibrio gazogenes DSM 21264 = NBRC 103151 TaxID=1123492 RepID=A0A1M5C5V8_VIBGA|nr:DUF2861 family protein [Vibrio gazogenes]USP15356.1 DUF2861 family protein [Vibrio gazogenes]SHF50129.1 Protein of unknown function [Vibrio gazogenes DSM 21264] [Vibrio gazogenes DSM 21264 = NBRC 103151]SJN55565.1 hypothetical protein BQ6471_01613 [Vibrio gazogenes]
MMRKKNFFLLGVLICAPNYSVYANWFERNTPLTQAHEHLLENDLPKMFSSLVEVWQNAKSNHLSSHLNDLLLQSLSADCGKSLERGPFPDWIKSLAVRRVEIQSPGRDAFQLLIDMVTTSQIGEISFTRWVDHSISLDSSFSQTGSDDVTNELTYVKRYNLNNRLPMGLYRLIVSRKNGESWSSWVILDNPKTYHTIHWRSKEQWRVEKTAIPNRYCPLPKMKVSAYSYHSGKYSEVWKQTYESNYPGELPPNTLEPGRYVLAVSMNHQRWQGPITIEQSQVISKTYDVSLEE